MLLGFTLEQDGCGEPWGPSPSPPLFLDISGAGNKLETKLLVSKQSPYVFPSGTFASRCYFFQTIAIFYS